MISANQINANGYRTCGAGKLKVTVKGSGAVMIAAKDHDGNFFIEQVHEFFVDRIRHYIKCVPDAGFRTGLVSVPKYKEGNKPTYGFTSNGVGWFFVKATGDEAVTVEFDKAGPVAPPVRDPDDGPLGW